MDVEIFEFGRSADFLRKIVDAPKTADRRISTHSFKSTTLSWTAKYGLAGIDEGGAGPSPVVCNNFDCSPQPRPFVPGHARNGQHRAIRCQMFHPDKSRSGLVTPAAMPVVPGTPFAILQAPQPSTPMPAAAKMDVEEKRFPVDAQEIAVSEVEPEKLFEGLGSWQPLSCDGEDCDVASVGIA